MQSTSRVGFSLLVAGRHQIIGETPCVPAHSSRRQANPARPWGRAPMRSTQWPHWEPRSDAGVSAWQACPERRHQMQQFDLSLV